MIGTDRTGLSIALRHRFGTGRCLDLALSAPLPGIVGLLGPSGSGKTTLASTLSGSFRPDWSAIRIGGRVLSRDEPGLRLWVKPEARRIGMVFQDSRLFPHLSVEGNLRYGARRAAAMPDEATRPNFDEPGFDEVVALLGLDALLGRRTRMLSGGERQRVAIGRALLSRPLLLAMDEPLASLDVARRAEILPYLARLRDRLRLPILYVTHALDEAMRLCDTLALIEDGRTIGCGPVAAMLAGHDMASRPDASALLEAVIGSHDPRRGLTVVRAGGFTLLLPLQPGPPGTRLRLAVPAREVVLLRLPDGGEMPLSSAQNVIPVRVRDVEAVDGAISIVRLEAVEPPPGEGPVLVARLTRDSVQRLGLAPGVGLLALVKTVSIGILETGGIPETGRTGG